MSRHSLGDISILQGDESRFIDTVKQMLTGNRLHHIVTANAEILLTAYKNKSYNEVIHSADIIIPDGMGALIHARLHGMHIPYHKRLSGVRATELLLALAESRHYRVLILVPFNSFTRPALIHEKLYQRYPKLEARVVSESDMPLSAIDTFQPDILFITFGAPRQEQWIFDNRKKLHSVKIAIGVGGTFDFLSDTIKRAPQLMRTAGLEWLWRLILEPKRIKRIIRAVVIFPYYALTRR